MKPNPDLPIETCGKCGQEVWTVIEPNTGRTMRINCSNGRNHANTCGRSLRRKKPSRAGWRQKAAEKFKQSLQFATSAAIVGACYALEPLFVVKDWAERYSNRSVHVAWVTNNWTKFPVDPQIGK